MHCSKCGHYLSDDAVFCSQCGTRQADADEKISESPVERFQTAGRGRGESPSEKELWSGTYSPKAMIGPAIGAAVVTAIGALGAAMAGPVGGIALVVGLVLVWGGLALVLLYRRLTVRYRLTTFRFFHDTGLLTRVGNRVEVIDIDDVTVHQGLIERMFGVGTIHISSSDATHPELSLPGIEDAKQVADLIDGTRRAERQRRGMFMENV
jgi:membrane protein YdbS with pleckstrin-like domain